MNYVLYEVFEVYEMVVFKINCLIKFKMMRGLVIDQ